MSLTRKRRKALKRLRGNAQELWMDQQALALRANKLAKEARKQGVALRDEELVPRIRGAVNTVGPTLASNANTARVAAFAARKRFLTDVLPAFGGVVASTADSLNLGDNAAIQKLVAKTQPPKKSHSVGGFIALGLGIVAALGIGYAIWQTFRADDELWISEDELDKAAAEAEPGSTGTPDSTEASGEI